MAHVCDGLPELARRISGRVAHVEALGVLDLRPQALELDDLVLRVERQGVRALAPVEVVRGLELEVAERALRGASQPDVFQLPCAEVADELRVEVVPGGENGSADGTVLLVVLEGVERLSVFLFFSFVSHSNIFSFWVK